MYCKNCGKEIEENLAFCPGCGEKQIKEVFDVDETHKINKAGKENKIKQKKPFYKRVWFVILMVIVVLALFGKVSNAVSKAKEFEKINWNELELCDILPEINLEKGKIYDNDETGLYISFAKASEDDYKNYVAACEEKGFAIDSSKSDSHFEAYNNEGYKLKLSAYGEELTINLEAPMEFEKIDWPKSNLGKSVPKPKSTSGKFSYEYSDKFFVYVSDTSKKDYNNYVAVCTEQGFDVDYDKGENYFSGENKNGVEIRVEYIGNNIITIDAEAPENSKNTQEDTTKAQTTQSTTKKKDEVSINSDFKNAMDSYEAVINEYVEFMKKYENSNGTDLGLLSDYTKYLSKYQEACEKFEKWEEEDLSDEELAYYIDVQARANKKLLEIAG